MPVKKDKYDLAAEYLISQLSKDEKHYEIVEDTYLYSDGLLLIVYADEEHKIETRHLCVDTNIFIPKEEWEEWNKE